MKFREIFKVSRFIYNKNIRYMLLISLVFYLPMGIVMALIPQYLIESVNKLYTLSAQFADMDTEAAAVFIATIDPNLLKDNFIFLFLVVGIIAFFTPLATGAATYVTKQTIQGKQIKGSEMFDASVGRMGKYLFTTILLYSILFVSVMLIVPYILFYVIFYFSQNAVADDGRWGIGAFRKSYGIVKGRWFKTLFFALIIFFLNSMVSYIFLAGDSLFTAIILYTFGQLFCLWFTVAVSVMYFNLSAIKGLS